ncbi:MAG: DUF4139 domain-containing protein [Treponema sp.]|jgi:flagellin-like hook-associated protein FlgL|nr:DUF4139 domain-containing protein [Treponema sp.]
MKKSIFFFVLFTAITCLWAQSVRDNANPAGENPLPLRRVVILTSGLSYYEHSGTVNGALNIELPFRINAVNDALKSLVINDPASANPSITYQSENTLYQTLISLGVNLSDNPDFATILSRLRGAEVEILSPTSYTGRIVGIEYRTFSGSGFMHTLEPWLLLNTDAGFRQFNLKDVSSISFKDSAIEQDLNRALDLIAASRNVSSRQLMLNLPGTTRRNVTISYVIPSPVWKVSYRLDLGVARPLFQGWAIVDNDSDTDWENVQLSLVAGRPTSFIQELYPPYYVMRPVLPLAIAGAAQAQTHERSFMPSPLMARPEAQLMREMYVMEMEDSAAFDNSMRPRAATSIMAGGTIETAQGTDAGGQFEFTIKNPVTLRRHMSAMLPLVESPIDGNKLLIYSGTGTHPRLGAEITNTTGMKLPAGPITVYDGGVYAGDALIEFWNENEKRLISFGEDLSVTASTSDTNTTEVSTVTVSGGVMIINRNRTFIKTYTFINSGSDSKTLVTEHNITAQTTLVSPAAAEQTPTQYRFNVTLPGNRQTLLTVREQRPISERIMLLPMRTDTLLSYTTNQEIPANVRQALTRAAELRRAVDTAEAAVREIEAQRTRLVADQDRIRRNLEAAGNQTQQGQEFLRRLVALDSEIDAAAASLVTANDNVRTAREAFERYLNGLNL